MRGDFDEGHENQRTVALHLGTSFEGTWLSVLLPWFEEIARAPLGATLSAVVTPSRSLAQLVRARLLDSDISILGLKFLSPAQLREMLLPNDQNIPLREHLRLLLAIAAEGLATGFEREKRESERLIAKSIARDPDRFLCRIDQFKAAGWSYGEMEEPTLRKVAESFEKIVSECGFEFLHAAHCRALATVTTQPPIFGRLLIIGFDSAHWPLWPLLQATAGAAERATVILNDPRDEARDLDETWIGTWEETFGVAQPIPDAEHQPSASLGPLGRLPETPGEISQPTAHPLEAIHFLVGRDTPEQAKTIVALTAKFLQEPTCERLGILFPGSGALPRTVAGLLESARITHNDCIGHFSPNTFDDDAWRAWLELQQNPRLNILLRFLRTIDTALFEQLSTQEVEDVLRRAYAGVLIDNLAILRQICARHEDSERDRAVALGLDKIQFLSPCTTLSEFLAQTQQSFSRLGWKQRWSELDRVSCTWSERVGKTFSRNFYLRWLREILGAPSLHRDDYGAHPYSKVHLLSYSEAEGQGWSHLIFAGLNEEAWPILDDDSGFVAAKTIEEFNDRNRVLNRRAVRRGRQGEGQWSIRQGKTLLLGPNELRQIRRRQLANLVESATAGIGATANLYSESSASRFANPNELLTHLYFSARGEAPSQQTLQALEEQTHAWLGDWWPIDSQKIDSISLGRTRYAYDARRQLRPAGEYEFALRTPPERPISLRVTEWEQVIRWPALVWLKVFLGVEADDKNDSAWPIAIGHWVHHWLADGVGSSETNEFVAIPETPEIRRRVLESAHRFRAEVEKLCEACAQALPDWWTSGWGNALYIADSLAAKLCGLSDWSQLASEWKLASPTEVSLGETHRLRLRGRIDLLLGRGEKNHGALRFPELWIVDYKTGRQRGFDRRVRKNSESPEERFRKQLVDGKGVQLALYALAAHALGAENACLTLLATGGDLEPQFELEDALAQKDFWRALHQMQESGIFGMLGRVHQSFGFARTYPLATLAVDTDLLREKWVLTHPALATETEEPDRE